MKVLRSDIGTIVLHWLLVAAFLVVAATGLRIASDAPELHWLTAFDVVLPSDDLWYWHVIGGLAFGAIFGAYLAYVIVARLGRRTRIDGNRWRALARPGSQRWVAAGAFVVWIGLAAFATEIASGVLLYLGQSGWSLAIHRNFIWLSIAFPVLHLLFHYAHGGARQVLRIFRPTRLMIPPPDPDILALLAEQIRLVEELKQGRRAEPMPTEAPIAQSSRRPLLVAAGVAVVVLVGGVALDQATGMKLYVPAIPPLGDVRTPVMDGDISDPIWASAPAARIMTDQGTNFAGSGRSLVEVKAVHDSERVYFAFTWEDPTRSLKQLPLVKGADGWRVARTRLVSTQEDEFSDDQFSVLLSRPTFPIVGAAIHLTTQPLAAYPASGSGRGLHYTAPGIVADVWVWRADHGGLVGLVDDAHFSAPQQPTAAQAAADEPYAGGFALDSGDACYRDNFQTLPREEPNPPLAPLRLPNDLAALATAMGNIRQSSDISEDEGSRWWMTIDETQAYSDEADLKIPVGTVLPSVIILCSPKGDRADVRGMARWSAGHWTLEVSRRLDTRSDQDVAIASGVMMWVAAFDHSATRHTRHVRPLTLEIL